MKKLTAVLAMVLICAFLVPACAETATERYFSGNFTMDIPTGWIQKSEDNALYLYAERENSTDGGYMYICESDLGSIGTLSLEEVYENILSGMTSNESYLGEVQSEIITIDGVEALLFGYKINLGKECYISGVYIYKDGKVFAFMYTDGESDMDTIVEVTRGYALSIKCGEDEPETKGGSIFDGFKFKAPEKAELYNTAHFGVPIPADWKMSIDDEGFISAYAIEEGSMEGGYMGVKEIDFTQYGSFEGSALTGLYDGVISGFEQDASVVSDVDREEYIIDGATAYMYSFLMEFDETELVVGILYYRDGYLLSLMYVDGGENIDTQYKILKDYADRITFSAN